MGNYKTLLTKYHFAPENIYNIYEIGVSTVMEKPKVGQKQVGLGTSADRGEMVTICAILNAVGNFITAVFIFLTKEIKRTFLKGAPSGCKDLSNPRAVMNANTLMETIKQFQNYTKCSKEKSCFGNS